MGKLENLKRDLETNIGIIESNYETLASELDNLRSSTEKITLESRSIGYYRENEGMIIVKGYEGRKNFFTLGKLVNIEHQEPSHKPFFRALAFGAVLFSLILVFVLTKQNNENTEKKPEGTTYGNRSSQRK